MWVQEVVMVISDAYMLSEMDDASMASQLAALQRVAGDTTKVAEQLRSVCLSMLCAAMQWDDFRCSLFRQLLCMGWVSVLHGGPSPCILCLLRLTGSTCPSWCLLDHFWYFCSP